ncbi:hypothetical protein PFICI_15147 [Pestalotiopsis fici W106-1]|uniref:GEgh 16 protein n=1 Tax=Pestalotiopsis fici (strain W106-1 / CGMCC3.15140) TaxID=1229662 RepID=W3WJ80_PESFW|nr:uncharacterized protein PFICI_15147 [Pestalotiopsis fici W106-1]ETS73202.1 hypothetical protein PFICI_15147 [Pestalotiopsis fici W106-1]
MQTYAKLLSFTSLLALVSGHAQILSAVGESGTAVGFDVDTSLARNCTTINPCQLDATIIRDAEINANIVGVCGRTEQNANIDVAQREEDAISANAVTQIQAGTKVAVTLHQVNADGAGPFACDLVSADNGVIASNLTVENNVPGANGFSQAKAVDFNMTVIMPDTITGCTDSTQGNVCAVRCRNNAQAGPFGGCFAVQNTDAAATASSGSNSKSSKSASAKSSKNSNNNKKRSMRFFS